MTSAELKVRSYLPLVDFIAEIAGANTEVVLHDVRDKEHSLVAIRNSRISGREVGASMTDFASYILRRGRQENRDFITNYLGKAGSDGKFLKSSTFFIRDEVGEIIGMLGTNSDLSALWEAHRIIGQMISVEEVAGAESPSAEGNGGEEQGASIREMVYSVIDQVFASYGVDAGRMTPEEKKEIVDVLDERGVFLLKGAVSEVAERLDVSEQTIYRYLK